MQRTMFSKHWYYCSHMHILTLLFLCLCLCQYFENKNSQYSKQHQQFRETEVCGCNLITSQHYLLINSDLNSNRLTASSFLLCTPRKRLMMVSAKFNFCVATCDCNNKQQLSLCCAQYKKQKFTITEIEITLSTQTHCLCVYRRRKHQLEDISSL